MPEQLALPVDPRPPGPGPLLPMLATPAGASFDDDRWSFRPTWGGHRVLVAVAEGSAVVLAGAGPRGGDGGPALPEIGRIPAALAVASAVLDLELVAVDPSGRPDRAALASRLAGGAGHPLAVVVHDLLEVDGRRLLLATVEEREARISAAVRVGAGVVVVPSIAGTGRAVAAEAAVRGLPGLLARRAGSPYLPGLRSGLWRWIPIAGADPGPASPGAAAGDAWTGGPTGEAGAATGAGHGAGPRRAPGDPPAAPGPPGVVAVLRGLPLGDDPGA